MYIRWSDQESTSDYTPTATNTAGTQRLANGSKNHGRYPRSGCYLYLGQMRPSF